MKNETMHPGTHKRFLDYRDKFAYFGRGPMVQLTAAEFVAADDEFRALEAKSAERDDEEEARYAELLRVLLMD